MPGNNTKLVLIEPDAVSSFGHYLQMVDRISEVAQARGRDVVVFGPQDPDEHMVAERSDFRTVFSGRSWDLGLKSDSYTSPAVQLFASELIGACRELLKHDNSVHLFMYLGSPPALAAVMRLIDQFNNVSVNICLFYLSFPGRCDVQMAYKWKHLIRAANRHPRINIMAPTAELARAIHAMFDVDVPILPHPSTTFSDLAAQELIECKKAADLERKLKVLFPGGLLFEKGFLLTEQIVTAAHKRGLDLAFLVRTYLRPNTPEKLRNSLKSLEGLAEVFEGELTLEMYKEMFSLSDLVVIPYSPEHFGNRTSGAFVDALYAGKPAVCHAETWMGKIIDEYGIGETVKNNIASEYAEKINKLAGGLEAYTTRLQNFRGKYFEKNSWAVFFEAIQLNSKEPPGDEARATSVVWNASTTSQVKIFPHLSLDEVEAEQHKERTLTNSPLQPAIVDEKTKTAKSSSSDEARATSTPPTAADKPGGTADPVPISAPKEASEVGNGAPSPMAQARHVRGAGRLELPTLGGYLRWCSEFALRRPIMSITAMAGIVGLGASVLWSENSDLRLIFLVLLHWAVLAGVILTSIGYLGWLSRESSWRVRAQAKRQLESASRKSDGNIQKLEAGQKRISDDLLKTRSELKNVSRRHDQALAQLSFGQNSLRDDLDKSGRQAAARDEELKKLAGEFARVRVELASELKDGQSEARRHLSELTGRHEILTADLAKISQISQNSKSIAESAEAASKNLALASSTLNFGHYRVFNRELNQEQINTLHKIWAKRLSVAVTPRSLGYAAHRICTLETQLHGRLATTVEDMTLRAMVAQAVQSEPVSVLEIGTLFGVSAIAIYDALHGLNRSVHLTLIDPLEGYYGGGAKDIITGQAVTEAVLRANLRAAGVAERDVTLIKHLSTDHEALKAASRRAYDLLIIDGDHSYAGVKTDFENYAHLVRLGGFILFDDYGSADWPDVKSFVDQEIAKHDWLAPVGSEWRTAVYRVVKRAENAANDFVASERTTDSVTSLSRRSSAKKPFREIQK